jgi:hypothetical protein
MNTRLAKVGALAVSSLFAITLATGASASASVTPHNFTGYATGTGATLAAAESAASDLIDSDYAGCSRPYFLVSDGQYANGTWWAKMGASNCKAYV